VGLCCTVETEETDFGRTGNRTGFLKIAGQDYGQDPVKNPVRILSCSGPYCTARGPPSLLISSSFI